MSSFFIIREALLAEIGRLEVKGDGGIIRLERLKVAKHNVQHAVNGIRGLSRFCVERTDAVKGTV